MSSNDADAETEDKVGFFSRLKKGLSKTRTRMTDGLQDLFLGEKSLDDDLMEEIETILLSSDVGVAVTREIMDDLIRRISRKEITDSAAVLKGLQDYMTEILKPVELPLVVESNKPYVILMVGVNGAGKTTTIGKLAKRLQADGKSVMLAAGDTFRAAAVEQLKVWGERNNVPVIAQNTGADSASVIFDALAAAQARNIDVLIADTAGRLQNKKNLMDELEKINRVMGKIDEHAPHETMLILDAATGQNAISQAKEFMEAVNVSSLTLTKLDGTAKGGVIFAIARQLNLPIRFVGVGEQIEDLRPFSAEDFVAALFSAR